MTDFDEIAENSPFIGSALSALEEQVKDDIRDALHGHDHSKVLTLQECPRLLHGPAATWMIELDTAACFVDMLLDHPETHYIYEQYKKDNPDSAITSRVCRLAFLMQAYRRTIHAVFAHITQHLMHECDCDDEQRAEFEADIAESAGVTH